METPRSTSIFLFVLLGYTCFFVTTVRGEDGEELEQLQMDKSEPRLLFSTNSTGSLIPDAYVSPYVIRKMFLFGGCL